MGGQGDDDVSSTSSPVNTTTTTITGEPPPNLHIHIQERGEIFFFYRPKVGREEAHSPDDVQRMYIVLCPHSGDHRSIETKQDPHSGKEGRLLHNSTDGGKKEKHATQTQGGQGTQEVNIEKQPLLRFIVMGRKSLPDPSKKSTPFWGFVEMVTTNPQDIKNALKGEEYDTATKGHRRNSPARALGEGIYRILKHEGGGKGKGKHMHTHLIYKLEFPAEDGTTKNEPQESLNVEREGSFLLQIKNPDQHQHGGGGFRGLEKKRKASFPAHMQGEFGHLRYHPADPPDFLNYEGCEFLLISASDDIEEELGLELRTEGDPHDASCSDLLKTFGDSISASTDALLKGTWV